VRGIANSERSSNGGGLLRFNFAAPRFNGCADGTTASSLRAEELHVFAFHQAEFNELFECFVNLRNQRTASHGNDNVVRQTPAKVLGDFIANRFRTFSVVGTQIDIYKAPAMLVGNLRAEPVHLIVVAGDANNLCAVDFRAENLCRFKVRWNENAGSEAVARSLGRCGIRQISRGRTAHNFKSECARLRKGDCYDTVFETKGGEADGIVLQVERLSAERYSQVGSLHQRRKSDRQRSIVLLRQWKKFFVTPQVGRPAGNLIAA